MLPARRLDSCARNRGRPQFGGQFLVEQHAPVVAVGRFVHDQRINADVTLAATGCDDHVHRPTAIGIFLQPGIVERQTGRVNAKALPGFHLALVTTSRNLFGPVDFRQGMDRVGGKAFRIRHRLRCLSGVEQRLVRLAAGAMAADDADPGDHNIIWILAHGFLFLMRRCRRTRLRSNPLRRPAP